MTINVPFCWSNAGWMRGAQPKVIFSSSKVTSGQGALSSKTNSLFCFARRGSSIADLSWNNHQTFSSAILICKGLFLAMVFDIFLLLPHAHLPPSATKIRKKYNLLNFICQDQLHG